MTPTQKLQVEQSENRSKIAAILDKAEGERAEDWQSELDGLTKRAQSLEIELRAALVTGDPETANEEETETEGTPEGREFAGLIRRSSIADYVDEAANGAKVDGASLELREELGLGETEFPIDVLLNADDRDKLETRADSATNVANSVQDSQRNIVGRVFSATAGAYMGIDRPSVPVGDQTYVTLTGGATADFRNAGVAKDAQAATFETKTVNPRRITARYLLGLESTAKIRGIEEALRQDLTAVLGDKLDAVALTGQAAVSNTSPAIEGLIAQLTDPTNPTAVAAWEDYYGLYADRVDGKYSADGSNVRVLVNPATYKQAAGLQIETSGELLIDRLPSGRFRASSNMPDAASNVARVLSFASGRRGFVQPVWRAAQIVRDPYTNAAEGQIALTVIALVGAAMVDSGPYKLHEVKIA